MQAILKTVLNCAVCAGLTLVLCIGEGFAQTLQKFPAKPIRLVVPNSAGSQTDSLARLLAQKLSASLGQPVMVDNRPGAGGMLGTSAVAKSVADGHTLLFSVGFPITAVLQPNLPYDPLKDFVGVAQVGIGTNVLVTAPALGVKSLKELIALAKAQPGKIIYSSTAAGTGAHLTGARIIRLAGIKVVTVAFKGAPEATIEVLAGRSHYTYVGLATALPYIKDGKLLALAATKRMSILPDVPALADTIPELGINISSAALLAPAGTPRPILQQLGKAVARVVELPDVKDWFQAVGYSAAPTTPEEYDKIVREQIEILSGLAKDTGLKSN